MTLALTWTLTGVLLAVGLIGSVMPAIPGPIVIFAAALVHALLTDFAEVGAGVLIFLGAVAGGLQVVDYLAGAYGAKKLGGTKAGMIGSILGSLVGLIAFSLIGLAVGCFLGAVAGELIGARQSLGDSVKVGLGSLIGLFASTVIRVAASIAMVIVFLVAAI